MSPETDEALVVIAPEDRAAVLAFARERGVEIEEVTTRALDPISSVTFLLVGGALAIGSLVDLVDRLKGGQVIDLRADAARAFYRTKDLAYGLVLIITRDGRVTVEVREPRGMFGQVIETIRVLVLDALERDTGQVEARLSDALGDRVRVSGERTG